MSEPTIKKVQLVINKITKDQYEELSARGEVNPDQLYLLPEEEEEQKPSGLPTSISKKRSYLYELKYVETDEAEAVKLFESFKPEPVGGCTSIRDGNSYARHYDWNLDESPSFAVRLPGIADRRLASFSVCRGMSSITQERVDNRELTDQEWKTIPYFALDGFNECGVVCNVNVVSKKDNEPWSGDAFCGIMGVRKVLDNARTAQEGAQILASQAWMPDYEDYSFHFMVCDPTSTWIVEDGVATDITSRDKKIMTNFRVCAGEFLTNGLADPSKIVQFDPYGSGLERYDVLASNGISAIYEDFFTKAYLDSTDPARISEFTSKSDDIKVTDTAQLTSKKNAAVAAWPSHTRDGTFWQSVHTSKYDFGSKTYKLIVQEDETQEFSFRLDSEDVVKWGDIAGDINDQADLAQKFAEIDESTESLDQRITEVAEDLGELRDDVELSAYNIDQALQLSVNNLDASLQTKATRDNISISYSDTTKKITLNADGHSTEIDAQDFIKDGMVESARYDAPSKKIIITFNTDAGKSPISVDVAALIHEYTAGDGLQLSGNQFSIDNTVATKQYVNTAAAGAIQDAAEYTDGKIVQVRSELANVSVEIEGDIPTKLSELDNDVGYLSAHQSLSAYATKSDLDEKVNKDKTTNAQYVRIYKAFDLDKNAIELNVGSHTHRPNIVVEYRDAENTLEFPEKDGVIAVTSDIPTKVSQLENDAGYLSAHQSLTAYATKDELSDYAPINSPHFVGDVWVNDWDNIIRRDGQSLEGRLGDFLTNDVAERDYAKLSSIPTVNNPEIILKQGDVEKGRFTLNQASGSTITFDEPGDDALWGNISGDLSAQADLVNALKSKATLSADNVFTGNISAYFSQVFDPTTSPLSSILELLDNPMWLAIVTRTNEIIRFTDVDEEVVPVTVTVADLVQKVEDISEALGYGPIDITQDDIFDVLIEKVIERLNLIASDYEINGISLEKRLKNVEANVRDCIFWGDFTRQCLSGFATETYVRNQLLTKPNFSDIGNGEITIRQNGQVKGKFTLNQTSSLTINLSAGGGGEVVQATWGGIEGDITDQQDLVNYVGSATYLAINEAKGYTDTQVSAKTELSAVQEWVGDQGFQNAQQVNSAITAATQGLATYQQLTGAIDDEDTAIKQYIEDQHHINSQQAQQLIDASIVGKADKNELSDYAKKENVKIGYSSATHIITLSADGVTSTIDASDFIKDGMVDSARYDAAAKKIIISFNTDAGKTPISVDVAAMVHEYSAGTGLNLTGSTFSVDNTIATKDYVNTAASGTLQDAEEYTDSQIAQLDIPTKTSDLVNDSGFLTEHQSLTAYALKTEIPTVGNGSITIKQGNDIKGTFTMNQSNNLTVELSAGGSGGGGDETDPVFNNWLSGINVAAGRDSAPSTSYIEQVAIGVYAKAKKTRATALGSRAIAEGLESTAVGPLATARADSSLAIGAAAQVTQLGTNSIQIGDGNNRTPNTLQVKDYTLFDLSTGKLVADRIPYPVTTLSGEDANGVMHTYRLFMEEVV